MKKLLTVSTLMLAMLFASCVDLPVENNELATRGGEQKGGRFFYYYGYENRKIFLNRVTDKVFVKFAPDATKEQFLSVVESNTVLRAKATELEEDFVEGYSFNTLILEGKEISSKALNSLKAKDGVASATYLLDSGGSQVAYTDEFIVKLKDGTSFARLQKLATQYDTTIGEENEFVKNQYNLYVSKASELDAIQTANRFYETGLFEFAEPNFMFLNADNSNDTYIHNSGR
jgi:hypothetical protein